MTNSTNNIIPQPLDSFVYPPSCYSGESISENIVFNHQLQIFSQEIAYIGGLEASGQITSKDAYKQVKELWKQVRKFKKKLKLSKSIGNLVNYSQPTRV